MANALDAIVEIFTWVGFGAATLFAFVALVLLLADGTWRPARVVIEKAGDRRVARWFDDDGGVGEALLGPAEEEALGNAEEADAFVRQGSLSRMRLTKRSPSVRAFFLLASGLFGVGLASSIISIVSLFARG